MPAPYIKTRVDDAGFSLVFFLWLCYHFDMKEQRIEWEGPEYVAPKRTTLWYVITVIIGLGLVALSTWLSQWTLVALIVVVVVALFVRGIVKPRTVKYVIDGKGITEGDKTRELSEFKAFGVVKQDGHFFVSLRPVKRFGMRMSVAIPGDKGEAIVDVLGSKMPMEDIKEDFVDKLVRLLKI